MGNNNPRYIYMMKEQLYRQCVAYALKQKGIEGESFSDTNLRVFNRKIANPGTVFSALGKHGIVIPVVAGSLVNEPVEELPVVLLKANNVIKEVCLYVPGKDQVMKVSVQDFFRAWEIAGGDCTTAFLPDTKTYTPQIQDLNKVQLPEYYYDLQEAIAERAHDAWALERQSEGWTYGPKRNDQLLETPDMLPYSQLPESEKQYDRIMASDILKLLISMGYEVRKK